ncbi:MAG: hypothetical protein M3Z11_00910 [Candidatus Dormibacteraeota bacterium]|nr:hypothetical protein [Candidatus Dormibacteraeota bacterium]
MLSAHRDLARLRPADGLGLYASAGELFSQAIFGRDSATASEYLLHLKPELARGVILTLARLQGIVEAPNGLHTNEEEPGKIHHEHRSLYIGGRRISPNSEQHLKYLTRQWGGDENSMTYYGSVDATPLFVRLVARYCASHGSAILDETVKHKSGGEWKVRDSVLAAVDWITRSMDRSSLGFVEFRRKNPEGIPFQVWKDSGTSYLHKDGFLANFDQPIAAIEVQGYAYDALVGAADLFAGRQPARARDWHDRAQALRERLIREFWMPNDRYFAMGIDRDAGGHPRWIDSIASNAALLLDTGVFDELSDADEYVGSLVETICGPEFLTEVGIRCRAASETPLVDFEDYHGSWAVWMKETFDVLKGLRRQGMPELSRQLGVRMLNAVNVAGAHVEFLYVSPDQRVMYDIRGDQPLSSNPQEIAGTNFPEHPLAWTVTGTLALKLWFGSRPLCGTALASPERSALEARVLHQMPPVRLLRTAGELQAAYNRRGDFVLNLPLGQERDRAARRRGPSQDLPQAA